MIGFLTGRLVQKRPPFLLLDVNGVGYELEAPMTTFYDLPDEQQQAALFVHLVVREDAQLLFGFSDQPQRELFRALLRINGVGPRVALAILSSLSVEQFIACIHHEDTATLARVPGIGKKTAGRMILDLRDRIDILGEARQADGKTDARRARPAENPVQDAIGALLALGYRAADAHKAVRAVEAEGAQREDLIRNALRYLSKS